MKSRWAFALLATAVVGCFATPLSPRSNVGAAPLADPRLAGERAGPTALVKVVLGVRRHTLTIPPSTRTVGIALRSLAGKNLILAATCGEDDTCFKTSLDKVLVPYAPGNAMTLSVIAAVETAPSQVAILEASAYKVDAVTVLADTPVVATGSTEVLLLPGQAATASLTMAALGLPPELLSVTPAMGAQGALILITGTGFGKGNVTVEVGNPDGLATVWTVGAQVEGATGADTMRIAVVPASASGGPLEVSNDYGTAIWGTPFTKLAAISLPATLGEVASAGTDFITIDAAATTSSGRPLATASVEWAVAMDLTDAATSPFPPSAATGDMVFPPKPPPDLPKFEHVRLDGKVASRSLVDFPNTAGAVKLYGGGTTGLYGVWIRSGNLLASQTVRVK